VTSATLIGLLRHRAAGDTFAARSRLEALLARADLRPPSLPPAAILCVRRLEDPAPSLVQLGRDTDGGAWIDAVRRRLDALVRDAARPADGAVPANTDAVLFRDASELLACLAEDWSESGGRMRWWWRFLAPAPGVGGAAIARALLDHPRSISPAIAFLERRGTALRVLTRLSSAEARSVTVAMCEELGLEELASVVRAPPGFGNRDRAPGATAGRGHSAPGAPPTHDAGRPTGSPKAGPANTPPNPPWIEVTQSTGGVGRYHETLIGLAVALDRAPALASTSAFATATAKWLRAPIVVPAGLAGVDVQARQTVAARPTDTVELAASGCRARRRRGRAERSGPDNRPIPSPSLRDRPLPFRTAPAPPLLRAATVIPGLPVAPRGGPKPVDPGARVSLQASAEALAGHRNIVHTRLGGVFYLLNVGLYLGIYGDFTQPRTRTIALDPWDFVELLARRLGAADGAADDPVWPLLAGLAGRPPGERPGRGVRPATNWRVDPAWLVPFGATAAGEAWRWSTSRGRLLVTHPAGFPVIDVALRGRAPFAAARSELARYGAHPSARQGRVQHPTPGRAVDRWIDLVAAYVRVRLVTALGLDGPRDLARVLFRHSAEVHTTPAAVHVRLSLDSLPLAIRIVGLDRDPGWIPAARRAVAFEFA